MELPIKNKKFQCWIWFWYILFSSLIVFAALNPNEPISTAVSMDLFTENSSNVEMRSQTSEEEVVTYLLAKAFIDIETDNLSLDLMEIAKM